MTTEVIKLTLGSTFRTIWVSSGTAASPIYFRVLSGSETMVSSYAGVSSGNGHFYADISINSPGLWKGEWTAQVGINTYVSPQWFEAFAGDTNQPGRYITWDDVVMRYRDFATAAGAVKAASHYISMAEARIDALLASHFTVPFSNNNMVIRDLTIDMTFLLAARLKAEEANRLKKDIMETIQMLKDGEMVMVDTSGTMLPTALAASPIWSDRESFHPVFNLDDPITWGVSSSELSNEASARGD